ncbi:hypothetical protein MMC25_000810 [Agyrium rufum]|nr:hypothetical protein [Agyrium rufum]
MDKAGKPDDGEYILNRDYLASARLNLQHYLWTQEFGGDLLSPSITVRDSPDFRIADIGTGTAIWPIDLAERYPSVQIDGFDISLTQAPPKTWLPPNVRLQDWDVFEDVPEFCVGLYDAAVPGTAWDDSTKVCEPGGYLQWVDGEFTNLQTVVADPSNISGLEAVEGVTNFLKSVSLRGMKEGESHWLIDLPQTFAQIHDLTVVDDTEIFVSKPRLAAITESMVMAVEDIVAKIAAGGADAGGLKTILDNFKRENERCARGLGLHIGARRVVGRKES